MESDDSCEISSVITRADTKSDLSDNQISGWSSHQNLRKANYPSCDGYLSNVEVLSDSCPNKQFHIFSLKLREQRKKIKLLEQERIGFLEQIASLCSSLEKKQQELVDVLKLSEEKAKYHAHYMTEVSSLLAELKTLFSEHSNCFNPENQVLIDQGELEDKNEVSNGTGTEKVPFNSTSGSTKGALRSEFQQDHRSRALINALSTTVSAAKNMNSKKLSKSGHPPQTQQIFDTLSSKPLNSSDPINASTNQLPNKLNRHVQVTKNPIASDVCILPSFCWNTDHVLYWLREYVCLPGGCLEAASRLRLDGKQLTSVFDRKIEKQLHLNDEGLRKKFFTALEDLRIHGPPGISRHPGPSHISYQWICDIWLKHHLGLVQLIPIFSIRRVDGRMLSSLITYKRSKHYIQHKNRRKSKDIHHNCNNDNNSHNIIISNPNGDIPVSNPSQQNLINLKNNQINGSSSSNNDNISNHSSIKSISSVSSTSSLTNAVQDSSSHINSSNKYDNDNEYIERNWQVAGRREMLHILLGLSHTSSSSSSSGADLSIDSRYLLGKKEAESLRTAIELLHHHNFNIELIEQIRAKSDLSELDLLYWTNDHIVKWLSDLGLSDFVHGINASGLHGAYMVLDTTFDFNTLIKRLHIPLNVAVVCKLEENLQRILKPARIREGISTKQHRIFRRRSISRLNCTNSIMQRSMTSTNTINGSCSSLINSSEFQTKSSTDNNSYKHLKMNGDVYNMNHNKNTVITSLTKTDVIRDAESLDLTVKDIDLTLNNPIGLTPRREKRRILTVTGDLMNSNRLTRVFTRGHKTSNVNEQSNKSLLNTQVSKQLSVMGLNNNNNNGINVNSSNDNLDWSSDIEDKSSTLVRKTSDKSSDNSSALKQLNSLDCKKTTPPRQVVQPHEAPLLDPFGSDCGKPRLRILLGQTNRLNSLSGISSNMKFNPNTTYKNISDHKNNLASHQSLAKSCMTSTFTATSLVSKGSTNSINSISSSYIIPISKTDF
uniref:SAM domain-containing protein n=1 Tax=Schistosoma mansoni TaxID=6183 RepID=A0A5K4F0V5_SCHMA